MIVQCDCGKQVEATKLLAKENISEFGDGIIRIPFGTNVYKCDCGKTFYLSCYHMLSGDEA